MKIKVFIGEWYEAQDAFNKWAKGKALTKEVIIHTHIEAFYELGKYAPKMTITVIHPEDPFWDATQTAPVQPVPSETPQDPRVEREKEQTIPMSVP